jgi:hypothetical protein
VESVFLQSIIVSLNLSPMQLQRLYEGTAQSVSARSSDGRMVHFPANILRTHVTHMGVVGKFCIHFTPDNRFSRIEKID